VASTRRNLISASPAHAGVAERVSREGSEEGIGQVSATTTQTSDLLLVVLGGAKWLQKTPNRVTCGGYRNRVVIEAAVRKDQQPPRSSRRVMGSHRTGVARCAALRRSPRPQVAGQPECAVPDLVRALHGHPVGVLALGHRSRRSSTFSLPSPARRALAMTDRSRRPEPGCKRPDASPRPDVHGVPQ
jgi:hypothetical protein